MDKLIKLLAQSNFTKDVTTAFLSYEMKSFRWDMSSAIWVFDEVKEKALFKSGEEIIIAE